MVRLILWTRSLWFLMKLILRYGFVIAEQGRDKYYLALIRVKRVRLFDNHYKNKESHKEIFQNQDEKAI